MKINIYSIKDVVIGEFNAPVVLKNDAEAVRAVKMSLENNEDFKSKACDLQLWYLYSFDTETGLVENNIPRLAVNVIDVVGGLLNG